MAHIFYKGAAAKWSQKVVCEGEGSMLSRYGKQVSHVFQQQDTVFFKYFIKSLEIFFVMQYL